MRLLQCLLTMGLLAACTGPSPSVPAETLARLDAAAHTPLYAHIPKQTTRLQAGGLVQSAKGALVYVPKDGLQTADGKPYTGPCEVHLREATTASEFVQYGLTTESEKGLLESGGMLEITATDTTGQPLQVHPDFGWEVSMPVHAATPFARTAAKDSSAGWRIFKAKPDTKGTLAWDEMLAGYNVSSEEFAFLLRAKRFFELQEQRCSLKKCCIESKDNLPSDSDLDSWLTKQGCKMEKYRDDNNENTLRIPNSIMGTEHDVRLYCFISIKGQWSEEQVKVDAPQAIID